MGSSLLCKSTLQSNKNMAQLPTPDQPQHQHHHHHHHHQSKDNRPQLLILKPSTILNLYKDKLSQKFQLLKAWESPLPTTTFLTTHAHSVQAMLCSGATPVTASDVLRHLPSLRLVVTTSAGLNHIDLPECRRRGIAVANAATIFSEDCADMAVGLLIGVLRKITAGDRYVRQGLWAGNGDYPLGSKLGDKRVGIVGLGSIGLEVAKRLEAFGCSISYNSRKKKPSVSYPYYSTASELASDSDVLIICCALTEETRRMINKEVMLALGKKGVIINIARGAIIDEKEMVQCLVHGEIGGAGLDVFENEPEVPKELFALDNVVLSPHRGVFTLESFLDDYELIIGNLEAFFSNKPLLSPVVDE